jgi:hypothetical protein
MRQWKNMVHTAGQATDEDVILLLRVRNGYANVSQCDFCMYITCLVYFKFAFFFRKPKNQASQDEP